jgi:hypothetical protein
MYPRLSTARSTLFHAHPANRTCGACPSSGDAPNGAQWWLNCGIDNSGWNPPHVSIEQLIASELTADGVFAPCAPYIDTFKAVGAATGGESGGSAT